MPGLFKAQVGWIDAQPLNGKYLNLNDEAIDDFGVRSADIVVVKNRVVI